MELTTKVLIIGAGAAVAYFVLRDGFKAIGGAVPDAFNPTSSENLVYSGASRIVAGVTGDQHATLGTKLYEWLNPSAIELERAILEPYVPFDVHDAEDQAAGLAIDQYRALVSGPATAAWAMQGYGGSYGRRQ